MSLTLRPYQNNLIHDIRTSLRTHNSILAVAPTGTGKTALASKMLGNAWLKKKRSFFIVHKKILVRQSSEAFQKADIPHGFVTADQPINPFVPIHICSIETLKNRLERIKKPDLIVWDEAHHCMATGYKQIRDFYTDVKHVGLTATPRRTDGIGLIGAFEDMVQAPPVKWFIDEGYLCPYKVFAPYVPDTKGIRIENNDYAKADLEKLMDSSSIVGNVVSHYRELAHKKKAVVFAVTITHSQHLVESFKQAGYAAAHIDGYMEEEELFPILQAFRRGELDVLVNIGLAGEGFDLPDIEVVIKARPTKSEITDVQQTGRALRPVYAPGYDLGTKEGRKAAIAASPKPHAIILDHAGNTHRHGLPCDERNWSLHGEEKRHKRDSDNISSVKMKTCPNPKCYYMHPPAPQCPNCGHIYEIVGDIPKELQGKLMEIDPNTFTRQIHMDDRPGVLESLIEIGKNRNEKDPVKWAARVYTERY